MDYTPLAWSLFDDDFCPECAVANDVTDFGIPLTRDIIDRYTGDVQCVCCGKEIRATVIVFAF